MNKRLRHLLCIIATFTSITLLSGCNASKANTEVAENNNSTQIANNHKNTEKISESKSDSTKTEAKSEVNDSKIICNNKISNKKISKTSKSEPAKKIKDQKQTYLNKLNSTENTLNTRLEKKFAGTTLEMREAAEERYVTWDKRLNEIYSELKKHLSSNAMNNLKKEQINWISNRDKQAKKEADSFKGGTLMPVQNLMSLGDLTKKRCYELVNNYMH